MSSSQAKVVDKQSKPALFLAEFSSPDDLLHAAEKVRDAGYQKWDVHTPYPMHGMDAAMGLGDSHLGWIVITMGLTGLGAALLMMCWMNGIDYPLIIGGKPPMSLPSMVPIGFELTILFSALGTVFGMFALNQLPRHHHPIFNSARFKGFSTDKFFISIEANDQKFDVGQTRRFLNTLHPSHVELVEDVG